MTPTNGKLDAANYWESKLIEGAMGMKNILPSDIAVQQGHQYLQNSSPEARLSIAQIVNKSKQVIETAPKKDKNFVQVASNIVTLTDSLITAREQKMANNSLRRAAIVFSAVASLFLIGIPFFIMLRRGNQEFADNISHLRRELQQLTALINLTQQQQAFAALIEQGKTITDSTLIEMPKSDDEGGMELDVNTFHNACQSQISITYNEHGNKPGNVGQFERDITRDISFQIRDLTKGVESSAPTPPPAQPGTVESDETKKANRLNSATTALTHLLGDESTRWEIPLQSTCNQTAFGHMSGSFCLAFNREAMKAEAENSHFLLKAEPRAEKQPILLDVQRDEQGNISGIQFTVRDSYHIERMDTEDHHYKETVMDNAIHAVSTFTLKLNPEGKPLIENYSVQFQTAWGTSYPPAS